MKKWLSLSIAWVFMACNHTETPQSQKVASVEKVEHGKVAIVIHGGAGGLQREYIRAETDSMYRAELDKALSIGYEILLQGGSSLDAVEKVINYLEDSPSFNAGKGSVLTYDAKNELDASIMEGKDLTAGAVAGVKTVKNPISLARRVMENSKHVMLAREGAEEFALSQDLEMVDTAYFFTEKAFKILQRVKREAETTVSYYNDEFKVDKFGTVGCVALDKEGNIAAGTSTGGLTNKRWARIGDSPIIGAGTYADNNTCGVSGTGQGEFFIRASIAHDISARVGYAKQDIETAAKGAIHNKLNSMGGKGGVIAMDANGNVAMEFNTESMLRAYVDTAGNKSIKIYGDE